jgi:hypothetical protein
MADIGTLNPEQMLQQQQILRQQKMAEMLMQQGMQQPQGQMVSGRYVAPSIFQNIAGLANTFVGQRGIEKAQQAQIDLAKAIRGQESAALADYMSQLQGKPATPDAGTPAIAGNPTLANMNALQNPNSPAFLRQLAIKKITEGPEAFTLTEGGVRFEKMPDGTVRQIAAGPAKVRAPIQVDTGTHIEFRDSVDPTKLLQRIPKSQMPAAGQVVETANGPMIVDTRTGNAQPIMAGGQPLAPKLSSEQSKDITAVNQQRATIEGAIADVKANKSAFSFGRGLAQNVPYGESLAGRLETPAETETRAYVFNNVSSVIKERAGAAQSAQELQRLNAFLPATTDSADQIVSKLNGFKKYLNDYEKGTRVPTSKQPDVLQSNSFASEADAQKAFSSGKLKAGDKITINGVTGTWK